MIVADHLPFIRAFESLSGLDRGDLALFGEVAADALEAWGERSGLFVEHEHLQIADAHNPRRWIVCRCRLSGGFRISAHRDAVSLPVASEPAVSL